jgi:hypothetical protein
MPHSGERMEYALYFFVIYLPCLIFALARRFAAPRRRISARSSKGFVFGEAARIANSVIPWAFAGR